MENKLKHLEFIETAINRMTTNSFLLKGWTLTLVSALFIFTVRDSNFLYIVIICFPILIFWLLDGYFLWQERLFKGLYDDVRKKDENQINFSMRDKNKFCGGRNTWVRSTFSTTLLIFYLYLLIFTLSILLIIYFLI